MKYRKKPVIIEAFRWTGGVNQNEDPEWIVDALKFKSGVCQICFDEDPYILARAEANIYMKIETLEGTHIALPGDYIIRGIKGELYPCKPDIFEKTYDPIFESHNHINDKDF